MCHLVCDAEFDVISVYVNGVEYEYLVSGELRQHVLVDPIGQRVGVSSEAYMAETAPRTTPNNTT